MRIIISPAKKMKISDDVLKYCGLPVFLEETGKIMEWMRTLSFKEAGQLWKCNEKIAKENYERFRNMSLTKGLGPAILSYDGIQYQYMAPAVFEKEMLSYVQKNLRILSGFYGVLKPLDGVTPYRLEMQAKTDIQGKKGLYDFWGSRLYEEVIDESHIIINLASKEYSRSIENYIGEQDRFITCIFGQLDNDRIVQKGTYAKMARGEMVRFLAEEKVEEPEKIKEFDRFGYRYSEKMSNSTEFVFVK